MSNHGRIEPTEVVRLVETYVESELSDIQKYSNRTAFDRSGVFGLHAVAAEIYAVAWADAERSVMEREQQAARRRFEEATR